MHTFRMQAVSDLASASVAAVIAVLSTFRSIGRGGTARRAAGVVPLFVAALATMSLSADPARAGLIFHIDIVPVAGPPPVIVVAPPVATGQAVATNTATGATVTSPMPPGGGIATAAVGGPPPVAISTIKVDLATQTISRVAVATPPGSINGTAVDINKPAAAPAPPAPQQFVVVLTIEIDPTQQIDIFLGPGIEGTLTDRIQLLELNSGTTLFDSTTTITEASPDTVFDDTGMISWSRSPGFFSGDTGSLPNVFSNNRWVLDPDVLQFNFPVSLDAGEGLDMNFELLETVSASISAGDSIFGFSAQIPEPATTMLFGAVAGFLIWGSRRARKTGRVETHG